MATFVKFVQRRAVTSAQRLRVCQHSVNSNTSALSFSTCAVAGRAAVRSERRVIAHTPFQNAQYLQCASIRALSTTTTTTGEQLDVWDAVRMLKDPKATSDERIEAITAIKVDAHGQLEKEQQVLEIIESGAVETLLELLKDADSVEESLLLVPAFLSLIRISTQPLIAQELLRLDAPALMAHFLSLPDPRLQAAACLTLGNIALDPTSEQAVSAPNVIDKVLQVLSSPHEAIQRAGATCVANFAASRLARERLCETEAIFTLSDLVSAEHCTSVLTACVLYSVCGCH